MARESLAARPPERLSADHDLSNFANGNHPSLDDWLRDRALLSEGSSARTYVVCAEQHPKLVVGYYAISTAMEERSALPTAKLRKGLPTKVPLLLIGRLAVTREYQGRGLGSDLLSDAVHRCLSASEIVGARAIIAHAIDARAAAFYQQHGFQASPLGPLIMMLPLEQVRASFAN